MARQKQAIPLQREPSDFGEAPPKSPSLSWESTNGNSQTAISANGQSKGNITPAATHKQAGLTELIICVAGIYASL